MRNSVPAAALIVGLGITAAALADPDPEPVTLRLLPLREGVRDVLNPGDDPKKLVERDPYKRGGQHDGAPRRQYTDAAWWSYGDIGSWFDGRGRVARMYIRRS